MFEHCVGVDEKLRLQRRDDVGSENNNFWQYPLDQ